MLDFLKKKKDKAPKQKKGFFRELFNDILFALIAVTIIRGLFIEAYAIPTGSMENSMLIGDHLFVSKLHYGARTAKTPIKFPLAHQDFWGTGIPSYWDGIQLPQYRLPGFRDVRRGEPVVFNYPPDLDFPTDIKTFYVKRCVAIPGDTLEVRNQQVYVNGVASENPPNMQTSFFIETDNGVHPRYMRELGITDYTDENPNDTYATTALPNYSYNGKIGFYANTTQAQADKLAQYSFVKSVERVVYQKGEGYDAFPEAQRYLGAQHTAYNPVTAFDWTIDFFGPLAMPVKGQTIPLTQENIDLYRTPIVHYEGNDNVVINGTDVTIDGEKVTEYTFKQGYYYMMGDNRHNSEDSRSWGFVPEDHIVGKPLFIFWSIDKTDPDAGLFSSIRWNRILDLIK
ncbi:MAG: S26 family signal peptidase [Cytophagales bacterium CG12_big_fil_rev_8_21_14_0_65_40_12]|nr:MAG: S26 family signal peptidase [Cytophagales bacterium CG12_big_fil_rev_8_21_14_0_65_40_12]PIW06154.1 MAG: signal peptidase I [Cytophagales bacterium CG17_big_fil_post_rev_8_21_14_2_50_40_13]